MSRREEIGPKMLARIANEGALRLKISSGHQMGTSWNRVVLWLRQLEDLRT